MRISLSGVTGDSIVDGPGLRLTIFTQGCLHNCPGCHNPQTHDPNGGSWIPRIFLRQRQKIRFWTALPFRAAIPFCSLFPALPWQRARIKSA